mmetsp:Transcript_1338/g.4618  ORF Transcript_1338/g.4618 Transcript_1338/m.4618 type:complete len:126 (-) Transcript_1338:261-638(-)
MQRRASTHAPLSACLKPKHNFVRYFQGAPALQLFGNHHTSLPCCTVHIRVNFTENNPPFHTESNNDFKSINRPYPSRSIKHEQFSSLQHSHTDLLPDHIHCAGDNSGDFYKDSVTFFVTFVRILA